MISAVMNIKCSGWLITMYVSGYVSGYVKKMWNSCIDSILVQGWWKHAVCVINWSQKSLHWSSSKKNGLVLLILLWCSKKTMKGWEQDWEITYTLNQDRVGGNCSLNLTLLFNSLIVFLIHWWFDIVRAGLCLLIFRKV